MESRRKTRSCFRDKRNGRLPLRNHIRKVTVWITNKNHTELLPRLISICNTNASIMPITPTDDLVDPGMRQVPGPWPLYFFQKWILYISDVPATDRTKRARYKRNLTLLNLWSSMTYIGCCCAQQNKTSSPKIEYKPSKSLTSHNSKNIEVQKLKPVPIAQKWPVLPPDPKRKGYQAHTRHAQWNNNWKCSWFSAILLQTDFLFMFIGTVKPKPKKFPHHSYQEKRTRDKVSYVL